MSEVEKFYEWMEKINSVHLGNHEEMLKAFEQFTGKKLKKKLVVRSKRLIFRYQN